MKKILMALTMVGLIHFSAEAQDKDSHSPFAENYKVCKYTNGYAVCGDESNPAAATYTMRLLTPMASSSTPCTSTTTETNSNYWHRNIRVSYDNADNPYEGLPSKQNDGAQKNDERNLNTNQSEMVLPANDGTMP
ncbi:MAG TPA: hypothetical protein VN721_17310 [Flavipsychrobacter sp.]|nr:hypothetical protein [Flavipsychrobacter sp.]